jgi:hypothetical protein
MKLSIALIAFLVMSLQAHAAPAVGDIASFQGTWGSETVWQHVQFIAFNGQAFTKRTTTKIGNNQPATQDVLENYNSTASNAAMQDIVNNCAAKYRGLSQSVSTPAGTFPTCKLPFPNGGPGHIWVGVVPFAIVRVETVIENKPLVAWITGYVWGR